MVFRLISTLIQNSSFCRLIRGRETRFAVESFERDNLDSVGNRSLYFDRLTLTTADSIFVESQNCANGQIYFPEESKKLLTLCG